MDDKMATKPVKTLKILVGKRNNIYTRIKNLHLLSQDLTSPSNMRKFKVQIKKLDAYKKDLSDLVDQINDITLEDSSAEPDYTIIEEVEDMAVEIAMVAETLTVEEKDKQGDSTTRTPTRGFPNIPLPTFGGDIKSWVIFKDSFEQLIHQNKNLTNAEKVHYLLGGLSGSALNAVSTFTPTPNNYVAMYEALKNKYDDPTLIANMYLDRLFNFKPLKFENVTSLNYFIDNFHACVEVLRKLQIADLADYMLYHHAFSRLPPETKKAYENSRRDCKSIQYDDLIQYVQQQVKICMRSDAPSDSKPHAGQRVKTNSFLVQENVVDKCFLCSASAHKLFHCPKFLEKTPRLRYEVVRTRKLCLNCLASHKIANCNSPYRCRHCNNRHHTLLHFQDGEKINSDATKNDRPEKATAKDVEKPAERPGMSTMVHCAHCESGNNDEKRPQEKTILLSTAIVRVLDRFGCYKFCRFLLDSGSQSNIITEECSRLLKLKTRDCDRKIYGIGSTETKVEGCVTLVFSSLFDIESRFVVDAIVIKKILDTLPTQKIDRKLLNYLDDIPLADCNFYTPNRIDGILGAEILGRILEKGRVYGPPDYPVALETSLGYVVMGSVPTFSPSADTHVFCSISHSDTLEHSLRHFWELEDVPQAESCPDDDAQDTCETLFKKTHSRTHTGRYVVRLPFKLDPTYLGDSYKRALDRFMQLEKKFRKDPVFKESYTKIIHDYLEQNHMTLDPNPGISNVHYVIPHHGVYKTDSVSTPLRIVFDGSCKSSSSYSLNDLLYTGPKLQADIAAILVRLRVGTIAFTADLKQMFRQIIVNEKDRCFQKIIWRDNENENFKMLSLNTVTFGLKCSPYLAMRVIQQLAEDESSSFPEAAETVKRDMYVDDLVTSVDDPSTAIDLFHQLNGFFDRGGFALLKWATNSAAFRESIPKEMRHESFVDFHKNNLKVLGMLWDFQNDVLRFKFRFDSDNEKGSQCTKRNVLSVVAQCYDPLGFLAPSLLLAKLLIKQLWQLALDWDETPPENIAKQWLSFYTELHYLSEIQIPRFINVSLKQSVTLIGFADACGTSYGAVIYLRSVDAADRVHVHLIYSKAKVAPTKPTTIPRLELCSCHLLAKMVRFIISSFQSRIEISQIFALADSMIALTWIQKDPTKLEVFVRNRVTAIQTLLPKDCWYHIPGEENASDILSRGQTPKVLKNNSNWLTGPGWLQLDPLVWPIKPLKNLENSNDKSVLVATEKRDEKPLILKFIERQSTWYKLLGATIYFLKFIRKIPKDSQCLVTNRALAESFLIKVIQKHYFEAELKALGKKITPKSLRHLRPFLDSDSLIRVGGRLEEASVAYDNRHPILLPKNTHFVILLIDHVHAKNFHTGPNLTLALLRARYWILASRSLVRNRIKICNFCFRYRPKNQPPLMGNLPSYRIQQVKAFLNTGVDYAGPIQIIPYRKRGVKSVKAYICAFVCMATKAIHIELVSDLSTANFLQAFKRFIARRGPVRQMFSDNGTNFLGAKAELDSLYTLLLSDDHNREINEYLADKQIKWNLIPPNAPHMGGLWEASIRSIKTHLFKNIKEQSLTYEELNTVLVQIEGILNSRPLCLLSTDPTDPIPLTPSHFLSLGPATSFPAPDLQDIQMCRLSRYQLIDRLIQDFWKRWHIEYLHELQSRVKWHSDVKPVRVGDVVLFEIANTPPLTWPLGVVDKVYPGADGVVRVVDVRTKTGVYRRPLTKIYILPTQ